MHLLLKISTMMKIKYVMSEEFDFLSISFLSIVLRLDLIVTIKKKKVTVCAVTKTWLAKHCGGFIINTLDERIL